MKKPMELTLNKPIHPEEDLEQHFLSYDTPKQKPSNDDDLEGAFNSYEKKQESKPKKKPKEDKSFFQNALDYEKSLGIGAAQGFGDVGTSILNIPSNIYGHFNEGKQPYHIPHPNLRQYYPEGNAGKIGSHLGEFFGNVAFPIGGGTAKAYQAASRIPGLLGRLSRIGIGAGSGAAIGAASNEDDRLKSAVIGGMLGGAGSAIPELYKGARDLYQYHKGPRRDIEAMKTQLSELQRGGFNSGEEVTGAQQNAAQLANEQHRQSLTSERESKQNLQRLFPNHPVAETNAAQVNAVTNARNNLREQFNNRYTHFNNLGGGQKTNSRPYTLNEIQNDLQSAGVRDAAAIRMGDRMSPHTAELNVLDEQGRPYQITVPARNARVSDLTEYMRQTRDAAAEVFHQARNAPRAEQLELLNQGRALQRMSQDAEQRIQHSITPAEWANFSRIQHDYGNLYAPFNRSNTLRSIINNREATPNLLPKMQQPRQYALHQHLLQNEPDYRASIIASRFSGKGHPLHHPKLSGQSRNIIDLGRTEHEIWQALSPEQRNALQHHVNVAHRRNYVEKLKDTITEAPMQQAINAIERTHVKGFNPRTRQALEAIESAQDRGAEINRQAKLLKMDKSELEAIAKQRDEYLKIMKTGLHAAGLNKILGLTDKFL